MVCHSTRMYRVVQEKMAQSLFNCHIQTLAFVASNFFLDILMKTTQLFDAWLQNYGVVNFAV